MTISCAFQKAHHSHYYLHNGMLAQKVHAYIIHGAQLPKTNAPFPPNIETISFNGQNLLFIMPDSFDFVAQRLFLKTT